MFIDLSSHCTKCIHNELSRRIRSFYSSFQLIKRAEAGANPSNLLLKFHAQQKKSIAENDFSSDLATRLTMNCADLHELFIISSRSHSLKIYYFSFNWWFHSLDDSCCSLDILECLSQMTQVDLLILFFRNSQFSNWRTKKKSTWNSQRTHNFPQKH